VPPAPLGKLPPSIPILPEILRVFAQKPDLSLKCGYPGQMFRLESADIRGDIRRDIRGDIWGDIQPNG
jgi:hypothetical protein